MIDEKKYNFCWGKGLVNFNSLSPNKKYFYQIQEPFDYYWGLFIAKISFLDVNKNIIYYNSRYCASPLNTSNDKTSKYVNYSKCGEFAYFEERKDLKNLYLVLINLKDKKFKKIKWKSDRHTITLNDEFVIDDLKIFDSSDWNETPKDKRIERSLLFFRIWFPKI